MGQWIVGVISFQKIFGLCGIKGHIVEIRWDVTLEDGRTHTRNVKIELEFWNRIRKILANCGHSRESESSPIPRSHWSYPSDT